MQSFLSLIVFFMLVGAASATGAFFQPGEWYAALAKPPWTPPDWVFPIAWAVLYIMIAIAGWRVYGRDFSQPAMLAWIVGLALNALWSVIMFGQHQIGLAALEIAALWLSIVAFIAFSWNVDRTASLLFVPYLAWVSYAGVLNATVYRLNPGA
jgi:tryptophan-rich sensory protein